MNTAKKVSNEQRVFEFLLENPMSSQEKAAKELNLEELTVQACLEGLIKQRKVVSQVLPSGNDREADCSVFYSARSNAFRDIRSADELIKYLSDSSRRLENSDYIYHYTSLANAIKIIAGQVWHLASPRDMNDQLEYRTGDPSRWKDIFFTSFMTEEKENIGMWSMYAQPWEAGVKIAIPSKTAREWIADIRKIYEISIEDYKKTGREMTLEKGWLKLVSVAYTNAFEARLSGKPKLIWSNQINSHIQDFPCEELTGYVKDQAWAYEKEIRIMADFPNKDSFQRAAIDVPDAVVDSMILTPSPLFEGDFYSEIQKAVKREIHTDKSLFNGKLNIKTVCSQCKWKVNQNIG